MIGDQLALLHLQSIDWCVTEVEIVYKFFIDLPTFGRDFGVHGIKITFGVLEDPLSTEEKKSGQKRQKQSTNYNIDNKILVLL